MGIPVDFYESLGVTRSVTPSELQAAYRKLARAYHPDVNKDPDAESRFKEISEAYDVLSDPDTRRKYDAFGADFRRVPDGADPEAWARAQRPQRDRGPRGAAQSGPADRSSAGFGNGAGDFDFDDMFDGIFGGRQRGGRHPVLGANQEAELLLTVDEAYHGGRKSLSFNGPGGPRTFDVNVPAGVTTGKKIRLAGQGAQGTGGGAPGDLFLVVRLSPDPRYRVDGSDITVQLPLTPWEAALGTTVAIETPGGDTKLRINEGTSSGTRLRLKGRGMPSTRSGPGDLYAEVRIMVPKSVSDDERRLLEELAASSSFNPRATP